VTVIGGLKHIDTSQDIALRRGDHLLWRRTVSLWVSSIVRRESVSNYIQQSTAWETSIRDSFEKNPLWRENGFRSENGW
jgi:hypothetical protein